MSAGYGGRLALPTVAGVRTLPNRWIVCAYQTALGRMAMRPYTGGDANRPVSGYDGAVKTDRPVLFYDGDCRFCRASARAIAALDRRGRFAILPFDDPAAETLLSSVPGERRGESIHVAHPDGWVVSAGDALIELARVLPGGDALAGLAWHNAALRRVFGWGYQLVAERRGLLSRIVPNYPPPIRRPHPAQP